MKRKRKKAFCLIRATGVFFFILATAFFTVSAGQTIGEITEEKEKVEETKAGAESAESNISIDFKDADIHNVLRLLAEKSGVNIVAGEEVKGRVTVRLVDVPWESARAVILKTYGLVYSREESIVRVTTVENLKKEDLATMVFALNYTPAKEVSMAVTHMLSERGKISFDERMSLLIVTDIAVNLTQIGAVIERVDARTAQVLVEAKIIEVSLGEEENIGINWSVLKGVSVGTSGVSREYDRTKTDTKEDTHIFSQGPISGTPPWQGTYPDYTAEHNLLSEVKDITTDIRKAILSVDDFKVVLSALKERTDFNLVSSPRVVTTNGREARIVVGKKVPIPQYEYNEERDVYRLTGYEYKDIGVVLKVTPVISADKYVTLLVHPEVSEIEGWTAPPLEVPIIKTRETDTQVLLKDGDTLAIGGLITDAPKETINKVPFLGNIPFLGWLFTHKKIESEKIDLVIFLTATILEDEKKK